MIIKDHCQESALKCTQHIVSSQNILAIMFTNTQFISQKEKDRQILNSKIIPADKTAHSTLNLKNWLVGKTISDAEILNKFHAASYHSHSKMWHGT